MYISLITFQEGERVLDQVKNDSFLLMINDKNFLLNQREGN